MQIKTAQTILSDNAIAMLKGCNQDIADAIQWMYEKAFLLGACYGDNRTGWTIDQRSVITCLLRGIRTLLTVNWEHVLPEQMDRINELFQEQCTIEEALQALEDIFLLSVLGNQDGYIPAERELWLYTNYSRIKTILKDYSTTVTKINCLLGQI